MGSEHNTDWREEDYDWHPTALTATRTSSGRYTPSFDSARQDLGAGSLRAPSATEEGPKGRIAVKCQVLEPSDSWKSNVNWKLWIGTAQHASHTLSTDSCAIFFHWNRLERMQVRWRNSRVQQRHRCRASYPLQVEGCRADLSTLREYHQVSGSMRHHRTLSPST